MKPFFTCFLWLVCTLSFAQSANLLYTENVPAGERVAFLSAVVETANRLQVEPDWLMVVMCFETARTFRPSVVNRYSGAVGLIQFIPSTARRLGTTPGKLKAMTGVQQLYYVEKYFAPYAGKMHDVYDMYIVVFSPAFLGKPNNQILYRADSPTELGRNRYRWNYVLDDNKDGRITIRDIKRQIRRFVPISKL